MGLISASVSTSARRSGGAQRRVRPGHACRRAGTSAALACDDVDEAVHAGHGHVAAEVARDEQLALAVKHEHSGNRHDAASACRRLGRPAGGRRRPTELERGATTPPHGARASRASTAQRSGLQCAAAADTWQPNARAPPVVVRPRFKEAGAGGTNSLSASPVAYRSVGPQSKIHI